MQNVLSDPCPDQPWDTLSASAREGYVSSVRYAMKGYSPRRQHDEWMGYRQKQGWRHGPVKNEVEKTHPCLVPYNDLPASEQLKDKLFLSIVSVLGKP